MIYLPQQLHSKLNHVMTNLSLQKNMNVPYFMKAEEL